VWGKYSKMKDLSEISINYADLCREAILCFLKFALITMNVME
jgi:hypothetical protein